MSTGSLDRRIESEITGTLAGLEVSPATSIWQISEDIKIICPNYNNISEILKGKSWLTVWWFSNRVAVFDKKGKLVIVIRMVIGWVVFLMYKRKFKK